MVLAVLALGQFYPGSGAEQLDWKPTRSPEVEAQNEIDDVAQMLEAQNERRRRRGLPDRTEEEIAEEVRRDHARAQGARRGVPGPRGGPRRVVARVLIIGCGGRGQALARELVAAGHAVRGTTRDAGAGRAIAAAGRGALRRRPGPHRDADGGDRRRDGGRVAARERGRRGRRRSCTRGGCGCCARSSSTRRCAGCVYEGAGTLRRRGARGRRRGRARARRRRGTSRSRCSRPTRRSARRGRATRRPRSRDCWRDVPLDRAAISAITHRGVAFANPLSEAAIDDAIAALPLAADARVLDVGCGAGELLARHQGAPRRAHGGHRAGARVGAAARDRVDIVHEAEFADVTLELGGYDLVCCLASSHAMGAGSPR